MIPQSPIAISRSIRRSTAVRALFGAALCAGLLAGTIRAPVAHAALGACRGDPIVVLSNGVVVDLNTTIDADVSDVQQVAYTLHAPAGTSVVVMIHTSGLLGPKERLVFSADDAPNSYDTATTVDASTAGAAVTTSMSAVPLTGLPATASASGQVQQTLHMSVTVWTLSR